MAATLKMESSSTTTMDPYYRFRVQAGAYYRTDEARRRFSKVISARTTRGLEDGHTRDPPVCRPSRMTPSTFRWPKAALGVGGPGASLYGPEAK